MNDPNGLVYYRGQYHLFYQHHPFGTRVSTMHWGHAVSSDLIQWTHLPIALYPDQIGAIWSGSVVVDADNSSGLVPNGGLVAMFSYDNQSQGIAYSRDEGQTWTMYAGNPVIPSPGRDFRDPKVCWHAPTSCWIMILAAQHEVHFYASPNLLTWTFLSAFGRDYGAHGSVWECPDLFPLKVEGSDVSKWVITVSIIKNGVAGGSGTQYFIGEFDGETFIPDSAPETTLWLDYGPDNYAAVTWNNVPDGRRLLIGWMNNWDYGQEVPTSTWRGAMTLPRVLKLRNVEGMGLRLVQTPVKALHNDRVNRQQWQDQVISDTVKLIDGTPLKAVEIKAELQLDSAREFGIRLRLDEQQQISIGYDAANARLFLDRRAAEHKSFHDTFPGIYYAPLHAKDGWLRLDIVIDWSSLEIFAGDGDVVMTAQIFPEKPISGLELYTVDGTVRATNVELYQLGSVWRDPLSTE
ncbi:MAG: glycoside hydrolase family 32 protein [Anaerolineae bacterium]|nr:glycoside hydrolase family 32 protein [Anaerolineae bacterium]